MRKLRKMLFVLWILLCPVGSAFAEVHVSIGINIPIFPELVVVPGYPVYYAPRLPVNYFFYDGLYWVFEDDNWYASSWYNGPWWVVEPDYLPVFILRIPVRYYRDPPPYFRGWHSYAPPRWDRHWGPSWGERRRGWDHWKRSAVPPRAPLPVYQRSYSGDRYPRHLEEQRELRSRHYKYQPRTRAVREIYREERPGRGGGSERRERGDRSQRGGPRERDYQRPEGSGGRSEPRNYERREQQNRGGRVERQGPAYQGQEQRPHERREYREPGQGRGSEGRGQGGEARGEGRGGERGGGPPEGRGAGHGGGRGGGGGGEEHGGGHGGGGKK